MTIETTHTGYFMEIDLNTSNDINFYQLICTNQGEDCLKQLKKEKNMQKVLSRKRQSTFENSFILFMRYFKLQIN